MPTRSTLPLVDAIAEEAKAIGLVATNDAIRGQAALVRSLVDELARRDPSGKRVAALHAQLAEELTRLAQLAGDREGREIGSRSSRSVDVLIVDDEDATLGAMGSAIAGFGYPCRTARSAEEALREYMQRPASLVVCDWNMPGMSGFDLCRALKHQDGRVYVILVTAFPDQALLIKGALQGVDDFLAKPVDLGDLSDRLSAAARLVLSVRVLEGVKDRLRRR